MIRNWRDKRTTKCFNPKMYIATPEPIGSMRLRKYNNNPACCPPQMVNQERGKRRKAQLLSSTFFNDKAGGRWSHQLVLLLYFMRRMQPIGYGVAIYNMGLKPFVVLLSLQFLITHSVEVLLLFSSDSPCYLPRNMLSTA